MARSVATIPVSVGGRPYVVCMSPVSAHEVAAELRRLLPGVPAKKLRKLLYYCQGHHLAHVEEPLFTEPVMAWDMGPVLATRARAGNTRTVRRDRFASLSLPI